MIMDDTKTQGHKSACHKTPDNDKKNSQSDRVKKPDLHNALRSLVAQEQQRRRQSPWYWPRYARDNQRLPEGDWRFWLILAGRGFGKTRTGAETVRQWVLQHGYKRIALLGDTLHEVRSTMIQGPSGLLACSDPREKVMYRPSLRQVSWPHGAHALAFAAQSPEHLRGPQFDAAWVDELAKFPCAQNVWDQLMLGLRLGHRPRVIITTTPKHSPLLQWLISHPDTYVTTGTTFDNQDNLAPAYVQALRKTYDGTRLGAQEVHGKMPTDAESSLWQPAMIQQWHGPLPLMKHVVVAIDPATTSQRTSNETGMIVAGQDAHERGFVLADLSGHWTPTQWVSQAVQALRQYGGHQIIAEVNNGGDLVEHLLKTVAPHAPYRAVHATRHKLARAQPIAALYEQKRIWHVGCFGQLQAQMLDPTSVPSPDRLDALVWALTALFFTSSPRTGPRLTVV